MVTILLQLHKLLCLYFAGFFLNAAVSTFSEPILGDFTTPAYPPRLSGAYPYFYNRVVVGNNITTSSFSILHLKNGLNSEFDAHFMWLMNSNTTQYALVIFSNVTQGVSYMWTPGGSCYQQAIPQGEKRPGNLTNAQYIGLRDLNGVTCDVWNATTRVAGAIQPILWGQTRMSGTPAWLHFLLYPLEDNWFEDWTSVESSFVPPLSSFSKEQVPNPCQHIDSNQAQGYADAVKSWPLYAQLLL